MSNRKKTNKLKEKETDWQERIVQVRRVTKVVKGGKKLTFRAVVIIGDTKRKVGVGVGRADDVNLAMDKAILNGKNICKPILLITSERSIQICQ
jgi:small subunit ribosomal protein S5